MKDYQATCDDADDRGDWEYEQEKDRRMMEKITDDDIEASRKELRRVFLEKTP